MPCPDLRPHFKHYRWATMPHSGDIPVGCDWADKSPLDPVFGPYTQSGSWTVAETAILYAVAEQVRGQWLDIGGATGWTSAHLMHAGCIAHAIEPMYRLPEFRARATANLQSAGAFPGVLMWNATSDEFFEMINARFAGAVIDGDHDAPQPLKDAQNVAERLPPGSGAVLLHDARGGPVMDGVRFLAASGFKVVLYATVHGVALCWRGELVPPGDPVPE